MIYLAESAPFARLRGALKGAAAGVLDTLTTATWLSTCCDRISP